MLIRFDTTMTKLLCIIGLVVVYAHVTQALPSRVPEKVTQGVLKAELDQLTAEFEELIEKQSSLLEDDRNKVAQKSNENTASLNEDSEDANEEDTLSEADIKKRIGRQLPRKAVAAELVKTTSHGTEVKLVDNTEPVAHKEDKPRIIFKKIIGQRYIPSRRRKSFRRRGRYVRRHVRRSRRNRGRNGRRYGRRTRRRIPGRRRRSGSQRRRQKWWRW